MNMKKIAAILLVLALVFGMNAQAFAAESTSTITIKGNGEFKAYRILDAKNLGAVDPKAEEKEYVYEYTVNGTYRDVLKSVTQKTSDEDIIDYIKGKNAEGIRDFADAVYAAVKNMAADATSENGKIENAPYGYYLFAETEVSDLSSDTISLAMLNTAGLATVTVDTKEGVPEVTKKVLEVNDSTPAGEGNPKWDVKADHDMGDTVYYYIKGTVSEKYADYASYGYRFTDTMDPGLTYNDDMEIYVGGTMNDNGTYTKGVAITQYFKIEDSVGTDSKTTIIAESNLKEIPDVTITGDSEIYAVYSATLNEYAVIAKNGNQNTVVLEFENDPYHAGSGDKNPETPDLPNEPGRTPESTTVVFTLEAQVNKVDEKGAAVTGAGFTLYKYDADHTEEDKWIPVGTEIKVTEKDETTQKCIFEFKGLDTGKYKLVETTVPSGYNKAADVEFEIRAEYKGVADGHDASVVKLYVYKGSELVSEGNNKSFTIVTETDKTYISTDVINRAGLVLPSTGGVGTTLFYIAGALLLIGSLVVIVTKKRVNRD